MVIVPPTVSKLPELLLHVWLPPSANRAPPVLTAPEPLFTWMPMPETPARVSVPVPAPKVMPPVLPASKRSSPTDMLPLAVVAFP